MVLFYYFLQSIFFCKKKTDAYFLKIIIQDLTKKSKMNKYVIIYLAFVTIGTILLSTTHYHNDSNNNNNVNGIEDVSQDKLYRRDPNSEELTECISNSDCNYGRCELIKDAFGNHHNNTECICNEGYIDYNNGICNYKQKKQLVAFLLSFFVGSFGVDWFYLAMGNAGYIVAGVFKLLTCGGFGIWWIVDWIRILVSSFPDGNHQELQGW